ncbi:hypothetical protein [Actinomadura macra]|uniref:hypothetical protein n=1 Tax=Actinomadura macra TaxID=46164 RepID=UPI0008350954|nr:hypothetical protein [Actinomadura macra]
MESIMRRTLGRVPLTVAALVSAIALPTSLASAVTTSGLGNCPENALCGWSEPEFAGEMTRFSPGRSCQKPPFPIQSAANTYPDDNVMILLAVRAGGDCSGERLGTIMGGESLPTLREKGLSVESAW